MLNVEANKTYTAKKDVPTKIINEFALEPSDLMSDIITCMVSRGAFPDIWKLEMVTPAPKVYPPSTIDDLRKISGLRNL